MAAHSPRLVRLAACMALASCLGAAPTTACAAVEAGDVVMGASVEERGLDAESCPDIEAGYAVLVDEGGEVLFGRRATEPAQIASLTKIMTAVVAADLLKADDPVTVTPEAALVGESSAGLLAGDVLSFGDALKALLTASGNDAAFAIAQEAGSRLLSQQGSQGDAYACVQAFVDAMNARAVQMGLESSLFTNPHGLDYGVWAQGQYGCALDVATVLRQAMEHDLIRASIGLSDATVQVARSGGVAELPLANTDVMLREYPGTCAAKTGYTLAAGPCVATAVARDGVERYAVVLASSSKPQRFADAQALYDWAFENRPWLRTPIAPADVEGLGWLERTAFAASWFMEGW